MLVRWWVFGKVVIIKVFFIVCLVVLLGTVPHCDGTGREMATEKGEREKEGKRERDGDGDDG